MAKAGKKYQDAVKLPVKQPDYEYFYLVYTNVSNSYKEVIQARMAFFHA